MSPRCQLICIYNYMYEHMLELKSKQLVSWLRTNVHPKMFMKEAIEANLHETAHLWASRAGGVAGAGARGGRGAAGRFNCHAPHLPPAEHPTAASFWYHVMCMRFQAY